VLQLIPSLTLLGCVSYGTAQCCLGGQYSASHERSERTSSHPGTPSSTGDISTCTHTYAYAQWTVFVAARLTCSKAALARLRAYKPPPFPTWDRLPVSRRAAVLILLFADRGGDLRVVITMRAASLRNFSGESAHDNAGPT
jgi:hypothetical protein